MNAYDRYEHAGVIVEIVHDEDPAWSSPQDYDHAGTIYSWTREFDGDERIAPHDYEDPDEDQIAAWFAENYAAALTMPLWFANYGSGGSRLYESDRPNCALVFTRADIDNEWSGDVAAARTYGEARVNEYDHWLQGNVWGIVIRELNGEPTEDLEQVAGDVLESVWGFIGEPDDDYIRSEARAMAESCAEQIAHEREEALSWACRDTITVNA